METRDELMLLTRAQLLERVGASDNDRRNKTELVDAILAPPTPLESNGESGEGDVTPTPDPVATPETVSDGMPEPEPESTPVAEKMHAMYAAQLPLLTAIVAEQVMPRIPAPLRSQYETWQVMAVLFRWWSMCPARNRDPYTVYAAIIRPASQIGRNLRMHLRRAISIEFGSSTEPHYRGNLLSAMCNALESTFPPGEDVETGRQRVAGYAAELDAATSTP